MSSVAIYVEGGGGGREGKAQLRQGFDALLRPQKLAAHQRSLEWRLTMCQSRGEACRSFLQAAAVAKRGALVALLVDAEAPVALTTPAGRIRHLQQRDGWTLATAQPGHVHLMIECMEAWIVADPAALAAVYGKGFRAGALSRRQSLDDEPKASLFASLAAATKNTKRKGYGKIRDASAVLLRIDPNVVAGRCPSFRAFRDWLTRTIKAS